MSNPKDVFDRAAKPLPDRPAMPHPKEVLGRGIITPAVIGWLRGEVDRLPAPEPTPDDPAGWNAAARSSREAYERGIAAFKKDLRDVSERSRKDFDIARRDRGYER